MSAFDEREPFKKRIVSASLTAEQRAEFDRMKEKLHVVTDGALIKHALAALSHQTFGRQPVEDDFGDASISRAMAAARERGDVPTENASRLPAKGEA